MSEQIRDGGPAFPQVELNRKTGDYCDQHFGLSMRDYFAAKAMHAELITCGIPSEACDALIAAANEAGRTPEQQVAWNAYRMADAMLTAREAKS